ncbi:hypothetical protein S245_013157 [Arachis hypogaea]|nr:uncharacterized protein DS421_4g124120 [Arachis hypogaea]
MAMGLAAAAATKRHEGDGSGSGGLPYSNSVTLVPITLFFSVLPLLWLALFLLVTGRSRRQQAQGDGSTVVSWAALSSPSPSFLLPQFPLLLSSVICIVCVCGRSLTVNEW